MDITKAQELVNEAAKALKDATIARDQVITDAYWAGASAIDIAGQAGITRQQVHRIVANSVPSQIDALRSEVMREGARYEDLLEDDQMFVDHEVGKLAKARGIMLV